VAGGAELDLDDARQADLAGRLEAAHAALGCVRYGSLVRVGAARVVLNPDNPLRGGGLAFAVDGSPATADAALRALPGVFAEAGRDRVVLLASPSSAPELGLLAEEAGYQAVEETTTVLLTRPALLAEGEPGRITRPLRERHEPRLAPLLADVHAWPGAVERRLQVVLGHRLDDPRHVAVEAVDSDGLLGVATGFLVDGAGEVVDVAVRASSRRRGLGGALCSAVAATLLTRGADVVWASVEAGGTVERFFAALGFEPAYDAVSYVLALNASDRK
jgi:ribosomal protein S18 acetylase RimI-like enzyme